VPINWNKLSMIVKNRLKSYVGNGKINKNKC
jgi:hypothetical protein